MYKVITGQLCEFDLFQRPASWTGHRFDVISITSPSASSLLLFLVLSPARRSGEDRTAIPSSCNAGWLTRMALECDLVRTCEGTRLARDETATARSLLWLVVLRAANRCT